MEEMQEAVVQRQGGARLKKGGKKPLIILCAVVGLLAGAYLGLCAYASTGGTIFPGVTVYGQDVGGRSAAQAEAILSENAGLSDDTPINALSITEREQPDTLIHYEALIRDLDFGDLGGVEIDAAASAQKAYDYCHNSNFFTAGWRFLRSLVGQSNLPPVLTAPNLSSVSQELAERISLAPVDTSYEVQETAIAITVSKDGFSVNASDLENAVETALANYDYTINLGLGISLSCPGTFLPAKSMTAQEIHDQAAGQMKNATYDAATDTILPEQAGAEFDVTAAQEALDAAQPGETISVPAEVQLPTVTAEDLKALLFRDVLGEARTKVGGTSARKSNVKLSAAAINEYVMNPGDVFSYNGVVGKRTAERGYKPAPAYVQGETVDEIGGGICQTSSTLYLACLRSNLEITERYAHRYIPAYITAGMDATVSWGGPDYKFTNDTNYPIKIVTSYEGSYLTVKILGTNIDGTSVKMTNEFISSTPFEVIYEDDPTLAPGTEKVKTTPYTGYKYKTYRNVYDANGKLISSEYEATSDYKSRNKVILRGPAVEKPEDPDTPAVNPGEITDPSQSGGETFGTPTTPTDPNGTTPTEPGGTTTPSEPDGGSTPEEPPLIVVET